MPAAVGTNFNRVIQANPVTAGDLAAGLAWVALNLDMNASQQALITAIDLLVSVIGADYNNLQFVQVIIIKNVNMDAGQSASSQLGAGTEQLWNCSTAFLSERTLHREWSAAPFMVDGPGRFAVYGQAFFGAFVGPTNYTLNVQGRVATKGASQEFPFQFR